MKCPDNFLPFKPLVLALSATFGLLPLESVAQQQTAAEVGAAAPKVQEGAIQEVIVTAQKRRERASKVPSAISVIGEAQLENRHITQLSDLAGTLPSVQIVDGGTPGQTQVSVRGIPTLGPGAVVGTYLDDTPLGSSSNFGAGSVYVLDLLPYDIARIELLRGPQGTLYGAGAMGGLLKYVTNEPELDGFSGRIGGGVSSTSGAGSNGWEGRTQVNVPLIKNELALRASFAHNRTPGYIDNAITNQKGINGVRQQYGRLALLWRASDALSVKVSGLRQKIDASDNSTILLDPVSGQPAFGARTTAKRVAEPFAKTVDYVAATVNYDLRWADLTAASSYSKTKTQQVQDLTNQYGVAFPALGDFAPGISAFPLQLDLRKFTQEFRLASKQGKDIEWIVGAFYTREASANEQTATAKSMSGESLAGIDPLFHVQLPSTYKEKALYGDLTYKFSERFDVTGGLRYAANKQDFKQDIDAGVLAELGVSNGTSSENVLTYMFSPRYHLDADSMLYGRAASGYRPGGPNLALPGVPLTVRADRLVNYELGMKSLLLNKRVSVELAVFRINWRDIQLSALSPNGLSYLANAGTAQSQGVELTTNFRPVPALRLGFNSAYTKARLTADAPSVSGKNGDALQGIPTWTSSLTADYTFTPINDWAFHVGGGYSRTGARNTGQSSDPLSHRLPAYGLLGLNADVSKGVWTTRLYAKNLNNSHADTMLSNVQNALTGDLVYLSAVRPRPRTIGLEVDMSF